MAVVPLTGFRNQNVDGAFMTAGGKWTRSFRLRFCWDFPA